MMVSEAIKMQFAEMENMIETIISNNLPPMASKFIINNPKYESALETFEDMIVNFMDEETGYVDGTKLNPAFKTMFPKASEWISIPNRMFSITETVDEVISMLIGKGIM